MFTLGQKNRETKTAVQRHRRIGRSLGMYLIRLAFAAAVVGLKQGGKAGRGRLLSGVREPLFPPEMRPSLNPAPPRPSDLPPPPINLSSASPFVFPSSLTPSLSSSMMKIVFISHLSRPGKYYGRVYAPAATSCDKRDPRSRKIDALSL